MSCDENGSGKFFYCNATEIAVTPYDFNITFFRQGASKSASPQEGKEVSMQVAPVRLDEMTVAMSPSHAKAMLSGFFQAVRDYEKNVGPITTDAVAEQRFRDIFGALLK